MKRRLLVDALLAMFAGVLLVALNPCRYTIGTPGYQVTLVNGAVQRLGVVVEGARDEPIGPERLNPGDHWFTMWLRPNENTAEFATVRATSDAGQLIYCGRFTYVMATRDGQTIRISPGVLECS